MPLSRGREIAVAVLIGLGGGFLCGFLTGSTVAPPVAPPPMIKNRIDLDTRMGYPKDSFQGEQLNPNLAGALCKVYDRGDWGVYVCWNPHP